MKDNSSILQPAPPLVMGAGLMIWGWQNEFLAYAILMALILESSRFVGWRWSTPEKEFNNIADLSGIGFFIAVIYIFFTVRSQGIFTILSIMPFVLFLLLLTQLYSEQGALKLSVLITSLRKLDPDNARGLNRNIDISLPYFIICLISASAGNQRTIWFYILVCISLGYVLWRFRPGRYHFLAWAAMIVLAVGIGFGGQIGMRNMQWAIERSLMSVFDQFMWRYRDPNRVTTAIGTIGRLKFSDRILLRVKTDRRLTEPLYLQEATYDSYNYGVWSTTKDSFLLIDPDPGGESWTLNNLKPKYSASIATYMVKEVGVVPVPTGTGKIEGPGIIEINQNNNGAVKMEMREGWIRYGTRYISNRLPEWQPRESDLSVSRSYRDIFERLANELSLYDKSDQEVLRIVKSYFMDNFQYSLDRRQRYPRGRYLEDFLFESRQGHCEFFATSTVLLLRTLGIPARYAVGYYISEYSNLERQYVGRSRHAHSWVLAYVNNQWQVLDTTPSTWAPYEDANSSSLQGLFDFSAWLRYKFSRLKARDELEEEEQNEFELLWLLIPLTLILAWRLYIKERIQTARKTKQDKKPQPRPGMDSEFYKLAGLIEEKGFKRREGETMHTWLSRTEPQVASDKISQALDLHYTYRFDPRGLTKQARQHLANLVGEIISEINSLPA